MISLVSFCAVTRRTMDTAPLGWRACGVRPWEPPWELALNRGFAMRRHDFVIQDAGLYCPSPRVRWGSRWLEWFAPPGFFWPVAGGTMPMQTSARHLTAGASRRGFAMGACHKPALSFRRSLEVGDATLGFNCYGFADCRVRAHCRARGRRSEAMSKPGAHLVLALDTDDLRTHWLGSMRDEIAAAFVRRRSALAGSPWRRTRSRCGWPSPRTQTRR